VPSAGVVPLKLPEPVISILAVPAILPADTLPRLADMALKVPTFSVLAVTLLAVKLPVAGSIAAIAVLADVIAPFSI